MSIKSKIKKFAIEKAMKFLHKQVDGALNDFFYREFNDRFSIKVIESRGSQIRYVNMHRQGSQVTINVRKS